MNINKLILGTVQLGLPYGINNTEGQMSVAKVIELLQIAHENTIDTLDTAELYPNSHELIGRYHLQNPNKKFKINTKVPHDFSVDSISSKIDSYLNELYVEDIEVLMFHSFDNYVKNRSKILLIASNPFVRKLGVSVYNNGELSVVIKDPNIQTIQVPFNLLDNHSVKGELLQEAKSLNKDIHSRSTFLQGLFFKDRGSKKPIVQSLNSELLVLDQLCQEYELSMSEIALSYVSSFDYIDNILIGVDSVAQLKNNLKSVVSLPSELIVRINQIVVSNKELLNPSLWR